MLQNCDQNNIRETFGMLELHLNCSKLLAEYVIIHSIVVWCTDNFFAQLCSEVNLKDVSEENKSMFFCIA